MSAAAHAIEFLATFMLGVGFGALISAIIIGASEFARRRRDLDKMRAEIARDRAEAPARVIKMMRQARSRRAL